MNQWYFVIGALLLLFLLTAGTVICMILYIIQKKRQHKSKGVVVSLGINIALITTIIMYSVCHSTYYKYNDLYIVGSHISKVEQRYGQFDLIRERDNKKGVAAYYIYTDNGPIMPDHLEHYYYMEYNEQGVIYKVYEGVQLGG